MSWKILSLGFLMRLREMSTLPKPLTIKLINSNFNNSSDVARGKKFEKLRQPTEAWLTKQLQISV